MAASKAKPSDASAAHRTDATIRLDNISKAFSGVLALRDVTVEFFPGEVHAILGENGAGKSTLMNIISGTLQPTLGEITFEGQRITEMTPELSTKLGIAISFQHPAILEDLSVYENLRVALPDHIFEGQPCARRRQRYVARCWPRRAIASAHGSPHHRAETFA